MLDRALQFRVLRYLSEKYPNQELRMDMAFRDVEKPSLTANVRYLWEHGLVTTGWMETNTGGLQHGGAYLTARGADFLADDGGLSAVLGVVTVKLHEDTIKALLIEKVNASDEPDGIKSRLIDQIKSLPADLTRQAVLDLARQGAGQIPDLASWLGRLTGLSP